jgi:carbohydrate-binding DOMON domain-containing protein
MRRDEDGEIKSDKAGTGYCSSKNLGLVPSTYSGLVASTDTKVRCLTNAYNSSSKKNIRYPLLTSIGTYTHGHLHHTVRQSVRQTDRQTDRQTHTHTHTHTEL